MNGVKTVDVTDEQTEKAATQGVIALQLHRGPAMTVRFKNLVLRTW
ncbi:MAG: family 16 glycoside hydrolase [Planctomycetota bacterium]